MHRSHQVNAACPMTLPRFAHQPGFAVLRNRDSWRVYSNPVEVIVATDAQSLKNGLMLMERHIQNGGEAAGCFYYEAGYALEPRLLPLLAKYPGPLCWVGLYDKATVLDEISLSDIHESGVLRDFELPITCDEYCATLEQIRQSIEAGEVYQINFTTRMHLHTKVNAWEMFNVLFRSHPVPYAAFVNTGREQIVSLSPEMFFEIENGQIRVKPMKGTAARGRTLEEDSVAADWLHNSEKNRAENVMIVDLMRNDLGRICRPGSVKTTSLFDVQRYSSIWQMTSTVEGELMQGYTVESVLRALFPSGSVTGAPKIRAMEHIAKLEDSPRGVYTGAIGFFAPQKAAFNVAIRTIEVQRGRGTMGLGSGVVYDSEPLTEWQECQAKAAFLTHSPSEFKLIETLYWNKGYRLLDQHLARMRDSAEYFEFAFNEKRLRFALQTLAVEFPAKAKRVRIALAREGEFETTHADFAAAHFGRVGLSRKRISSNDRFLFHKTTNRDIYTRELAAARNQQLDDVLFFNEAGELTEGTIHNVFVVKDGVWRTPPVTCGLLPGVFRAEILRTQANACEAVLHLDDLHSADAVYLCNSVQGIFSVEVVWDAKRRNKIEETASVV